MPQGHAHKKSTGPSPYRRIVEQPSYTLSEAARYLHLPRSKVASWVHGRDYLALRGRQPRAFAPAIVIADPHSRTVSFENLVEMHVLSSLRRKYDIPLPRIREAMRYLRALWDTEHPLASVDPGPDSAAW